MAKGKFRDKVIVKKRMLFIFSILFLLFFGLTIRLGYIMIYKSDEYKGYAIEQWTSDVVINAKRGKILDRNGNEFAISANVYQVYLDLNTIKKLVLNKKTTNDKIASELSSVLNISVEDINKALNKKLPNGTAYQGIVLKRRIEKDVADKVNALKISGVVISPDTQRFYPYNNFLSQVIGHTTADGEGLTGVEKKYNIQLSGIPGRRIAEIDSKANNELPYNISKYTPPIDGKDVELSIDEMIQHFCEKAADAALKDNKAKAVTIIVMDPNNGEVLGMVNKPDYNPNNPWEKGKSLDDLNNMWRNRAVSDSFEPGSIFKVITAATALEENIGVNDKFTCGPNGFKIGNHTIRCAGNKIHGIETLSDILKNSCNVGFAQLGTTIGRDKLAASIKKFGFGKTTGIDLLGEASGIVKPSDKISQSDLATISFGQTNTVTPIQYLAAFNAVANGGTWITPHVMKEIKHYDESTNTYVTDSVYDNYNKKKVMDEKNAEVLRTYLERVISEGGGRQAFIEGYKIAGKTGTAQKPNTDRAGYAPGKYRASFAAMAPSDKPVITVFVSIDEPDPSLYYAGLIAAPVAKDIFFNVFNYLSFKTGVTTALLKDVVVPDVRGMKKETAIKTLKDLNLNFDCDNKGEYVINSTPVPGYVVKEGGKVVLYTGTSPNYNKVVTVPSLSGYSKEKAIDILNSLGLKPIFNGDGVISGQDVDPMTSVPKGTVITFQLEGVND